MYKCHFSVLDTSGSQVIRVGESHLPFGQVPLLLHNGEVTLQTSSGKVASIILDTHNFSDNPSTLSPDQVSLTILKSLSAKLTSIQ